MTSAGCVFEARTTVEMCVQHVKATPKPPSLMTTKRIPPELEAIGDLHGRCRRAIHLQCAGGRDTLSLWNLGADSVVGVDFSPRLLDLPRLRRQLPDLSESCRTGFPPTRTSRRGRRRPS